MNLEGEIRSKIFEELLSSRNGVPDRLQRPEERN